MPIEPPNTRLFQLAVPISTADGELLYCLRHTNADHHSWGRSEFYRNSIIYRINLKEAGFNAFANAGELLLWPAGDQTYLEGTLPCLPSERDALRYILSVWPYGRRQKAHPNNLRTTAVDRLVSQIMNHILADQEVDLEFANNVPISVLKEYCQAIQDVIKKALQYQQLKEGEEIKSELHYDIYMALLQWTFNRDSLIDYQPPLLQILWRAFKTAFLDGEKYSSVELLETLTPGMQAELGFKEILALVQKSVQLISQRSEEYHNRIVTMLLERVKIHSVKPRKRRELREPAQAKPPRLKKGQPLWVQIENRGNERELLKLWLENRSAKEIALILNITQERVYNIVSDLRRRYGLSVVPYRDENRKKKTGT